MLHRGGQSRDFLPAYAARFRPGRLKGKENEKRYSRNSHNMVLLVRINGRGRLRLGVLPLDALGGCEWNSAMMCQCGGMMKVYKHERHGQAIEYLLICHKCGRKKTTRSEIIHTYKEG